MQTLNSITINKLLKMNKIKYTIIIIITVLFAFPQSFKAQTNSLYFMDGVHQSVYLNPAYQSSCNGFLGLPALSGIQAEAVNSGFTFDDIIHSGTGAYSDSLILDIDGIKDKLGSSNYIMLGNVVPVLGMGFWIKNYYFTLDISNKTKIRMSYPFEILKIIDGNANYIGNDNPLQIRDLGPDFVNYHEIALGLSKRLTHRLFIGGRIKVLFGNMSVESKKSNFTLITDDITYALHMKTDLDYNISGPVTVTTDSTGQFEGIDINTADLTSNFLSTKNMGAGLDLGATYQYDDRLKLYGSITDFGFIRWKENTVNLKANGTFDFTGLDLDSISNPNFSGVDVLVDSLMNLFDFTQTNNAYTTYLNTNIYLGASYDIGNFMNFGLLSKTTFYDKKAHQSFTLSANFKPVKWFSGTLSYSASNRSYNSFGIGLAFNGGPFQLYVLTDNLNAAFWPKGAKVVGLQVGLNLNFGCGKRDDYSIINNKKMEKDIDFM